MGINCQVIKNNNKEIERIEAPNGKDSLLYYSASRLISSKEKAMEVWAMAYTPEFLSHYGNWLNPKQSDIFDVDVNGEPLINDVLAFIERKSYVIGSYTANDVKNLNQFMMSVGSIDISSLVSIFSNNMIINGSVVVNQETLSRAGLYTTSEINRIMLNSKIIGEVSSSIRSLVDLFNSIDNEEKLNYFTKQEIPDGPVILSHNSYNTFGKNNIYSPSELDMNLKSIVGGIKDLSKFNSLIQSLEDKYPALVEKYNSDKEFAEYIYDEYSSMIMIPRVFISNGLLDERPTSTAGLIVNHSHPNASKMEEAKSVFSKFLSLSENDWKASDIYKELKTIEKVMTWFGIDVIGIADIYRNDTNRMQYEYDSFVATLDSFITALHGNNDIDVSEISSIIDSAIGGKETSVVQGIPGSDSGVGFLYLESNENPSDIFNNNSLLEIKPNIYKRIRKSNDIQSLYGSLSEYIKSNSHLIPSSYYSSSFFMNGILDPEKIKDASTEEIQNSLKKYVMSNIDASNTEEMILTRIALGSPVKIVRDKVDIQREFNRYMNIETEIDLFSKANSIYNKYLLNKLNDTELYKSVYSKIKFNQDGSISLNQTDINTLKDIDLSIEGNDRLELFEYAMSSPDQSMSDLFFLMNKDLKYAGQDFYHYLYSRNPYMLKETDTSKIKIVGDNIIAIGIYDNYIRIGNYIYSKITESNEGSVYNTLIGTETQIKNQMLNKTKPVISDINNTIGSDILTVDMNLSKDDQISISKLEC